MWYPPFQKPEAELATHQCHDGGNMGGPTAGANDVQIQSKMISLHRHDPSFYKATLSDVRASLEDKDR